MEEQLLEPLNPVPSQSLQSFNITPKGESQGDVIREMLLSRTGSVVWKNTLVEYPDKQILPK